MPFNWPWTLRPGRKTASVERKSGGSGFVAIHAQGEARWTRRDYVTLAREGYMRNPVVHRSVRLIAETAAAVPWLLYVGATEYDEHPVLELLARPNQRQAGSSFLEALYGNLLLAGNAYVELIGPSTGSGQAPSTGSGQASPARATEMTPSAASGDISLSMGEIAAELHLLRPDRVTVLTDARGWPIALEYREGGVRRKIGLGPSSSPSTGSGLDASRGPGHASVGEGNGLQLSLFHPIDDHYGFPPLEAALIALDTHNAAGRWNKALLDNSARPSGALVYAPKEGGNLSDEQFDRLKTEMEEGYSGTTRAGRPLLLEGGLDWKAMSLTPKDMDFIEAKNSASRDIALAFGVPPMLLGIPGDNTYANYQEANRAFYRLTILPLVARTAKEFSAWLGPVFGEELRLWFDADQIEGLAGERDALWKRVEAASFLSDDEKREAVGYGSRQSAVGSRVPSVP